MKYCPKCGTQVEDHVNFCPNCGENLDPNGARLVTSVPKAPVSVTVTNESPTIGILAIIFCLLGGMIWLGLIFAIIGLAQYKTKHNRSLCHVALGICVAWIVLIIVLALNYQNP